MHLYKIDTIRTHNSNENAAEKIAKLWASNQPKLPLNMPCYAIYDHYESDFKGYYDVSIATEQQPNENSDLLEINDFTFYEIFRTDKNNLLETWQRIWRKEQQGLLKRSYQVDFEKHYPDNKIDIYISVIPHC